MVRRARVEESLLEWTRMNSFNLRDSIPPVHVPAPRNRLPALQIVVTPAFAFPPNVNPAPRGSGLC